jgi:hypothetical protein
MHIISIPDNLVHLQSFLFERLFFGLPGYYLKYNPKQANSLFVKWPKPLILEIFVEMGSFWCHAVYLVVA